MKENLSPFKNLKDDLPASLVVFLVAMPLCLGIALASGAPLFSGLIAGIIGGLVIGSLSGSALGVSGPAAGLTVIVVAGIQDLGSYEAFLLAVVFSGVFQIIMGFLRTGVIAYYFPTSVIQGMLAAIGIIIFLKQIPHAMGYDAVPEGDLTFSQSDNENTFSELAHLMDKVSFGPLLVALLSLVILILWETKFFKEKKIFRLIQAPLIVVVSGIVIGELFATSESLAISAEHMVSIPVAGSLKGFLSNFTLPDFNQWNNHEVYFVGLIIAVVGSLETLLCLEATDKLDPLRRTSPANRELKAQGVGNILSGLVGGLPITQVIVRSSTNIQAGGKTKASAVLHGLIILLSVLFIPTLLNKIPLASLAAILLLVGYKLAKPSLFYTKFKQGKRQFIPFFATVVGIVLTDLLTGIGIGLCVSIIWILYQNFQIPILVDNEVRKPGEVYVALAQDVSFFKKATLKQILAAIPDDKHVVIDASKTFFIHPDVLDIIEDFKISCEPRNITLDLVELYDEKDHLDSRIHIRGVDPTLARK